LCSTLIIYTKLYDIIVVQLNRCRFMVGQTQSSIIYKCTWRRLGITNVKLIAGFWIKLGSFSLYKQLFTFPCSIHISACRRLTTLLLKVMWTGECRLSVVRPIFRTVASCRVYSMTGNTSEWLESRWGTIRKK
jgi:hypothetical protein